METPRAIPAGRARTPAVRFLRPRRDMPLAGLVMLVLAAVGCDDPGPDQASASPTGPQGAAPPAEVMDRSGRCLVTVRTSWTDTGLLGGRRELEGAGVILVCDGQRALVLTSRRLADPPFDSRGARGVRDVMFQVVPSRGPAGQSHYARLVAVYMNAADLALLRIDAPSGERFSMPLLHPGQLRTGEQVAVVGPADQQGPRISAAQITDLWPDTRLAGRQVRVNITSGPAGSQGIVLSHRGTRLAGVVTAQRGSSLTVVAAGGLTQPDYWEFLTEEAVTRQLLGMIR